jgi:hypothetical protein
MRSYTVYPRKREWPTGCTIMTTWSRSGQRQQSRHNCTTPRKIQNTNCDRRRKNPGAPIGGGQTRNLESGTQSPDSRAPRTQQNITVGPRKILLARDEGMDCRVCQRVHNMSTKQSTHTQKDNANIPNTNGGKCLAIPKSGHGSNHGTTSSKGKGHNTHNHGPGLFTSGNLPAMQHHHYGTRNCPAIP